jgi:hypothetical protein
MNKLRIKSLGVLSVAKIYSVMGLIFGLLIGVPYGLFIIVFSLIGAGGAGGDAALAIGGGGIVMGIIVMIGLPVGYALMAFISGVIGALIYNLFAAMVGGIEIEVENVH